eukprot:12297186-Ditylum_brightwellii.AAC.1
MHHFMSYSELTNDRSSLEFSYQKHGSAIGVGGNRAEIRATVITGANVDIGVVVRIAVGTGAGDIIYAGVEAVSNKGSTIIVIIGVNTRGTPYDAVDV